MAQNLTTAENARLFALLSLSIADGVIAFYDAKYIYNFWRPVTAIRAQSTLKHLLVRPPGYSRLPAAGPRRPGRHRREKSVTLTA